jgi:cell division transport system ATP-binding protein
MKPPLQLKNVTIQYGERVILQDVSLTLQKGEFVYLTGRTGSGKTSLLRTIYGDLRPAKGEVWVGDTEVTSLPPHKLPFLRRKLGIVFQDFQLLPYRTVYENVAFALEVTGWRDRKAIRDRVMEVLFQVGLSARKDAYPHELSGGEQQRTCIARALVGAPILLLADEPTGNLDPEVGKEIMALLHQIARWGTALLVATHYHPYLEMFPAPAYQCLNQHLVPWSVHAQ